MWLRDRERIQRECIKRGWNMLRTTKRIIPKIQRENVHGKERMDGKLKAELDWMGGERVCLSNWLMNGEVKWK